MALANDPGPMKCQEVDGSANGTTWTTLVPAAAYTPEPARPRPGGVGQSDGACGLHLVTLKM
jgi:hypothetical protein